MAEHVGTRNMAAANSLARLENEAGFPDKIFYEGSAN